MKKINKIALVGTKVVEICHWVALGIMAAATLCALIVPQYIKYFAEFEICNECGVLFDTYGFVVKAEVVNGNVDMLTFGLYGIGTVIIFGIMAMIFNRLHLIIDKSNGSTPFQEVNVKNFKLVGYLAIAIPAVSLLMSIIIRLVIGSEAAELSSGLDGIIIGLTVLCFTEYIAHGVKIEEDVEGLV